MKRISIVVLIAASLTGCASFGEQVAKCQQESGADVNTCAMIVQQRQAQFAAAMQQASANWQAQQNANTMANALQNQNVTVNRGYGW